MSDSIAAGRAGHGGAVPEPVKSPNRRLSRVMEIASSAVLFNISWLAIVINESNAIAVAVVAAHLLVHFWLLGRDAGEVRLVLLLSTLGFGLDQLLFSAGLFTAGGGTAPLWLSCLWPVFATTLCHAFHPLWGRITLATVAGAVGGTGSYIAGTRLTAVAFSDPLWGPVALAILWGLLFPALLALAARMVKRDAPAL